MNVHRPLTAGQVRGWRDEQVVAAWNELRAKVRSSGWACEEDLPRTYLENARLLTNECALRFLQLRLFAD